MSSTLSTSAMIAALQVKHPIGIGANQWLSFLNEAFRKINQMSKGGFVWQLKQTTLIVPAGAIVPVALPADFNPGKSAFLFGNGVSTPTATVITYKTPSEFLKEQHFKESDIGAFSSWTFAPAFTFGPPTVYGWNLLLAPNEAYPLPGITPLGFFYHAMSFAPFTNAANVFFPTPDEFDSLIMDLAEAESRREYNSSGWEKLAGQATTSLNEMIGSYRTDRFNLAGLQDVLAQAQEKSAERDR